MTDQKPLFLTPAARGQLLKTFTGILEQFQHAEAEGLAKTARLRKDDMGGDAAPLAMAEGTPPCPQCGSGRSLKMGTHRGTDHFTCWGCGTDHETPSKGSAPAPQPVQKSLTAGSPNVAPGQKTGGAALGKAWRAGGPPPKTGSLAPANGATAEGKEVATPGVGTAKPAMPQGKPMVKASVSLAMRHYDASVKKPAPKPPAPAPAPQPTAKAETHIYSPKRPGATSGCKACGEAPNHTFHTGPKGPPQKPVAPTQKAEPMEKASVARAMRSYDTSVKPKPAAPATPAPKPAAPAMAKAGPPPVPPEAGGARPALAGAKIPPRIPGSALGGKLAPTKLPGMTPAPGARPPVKLQPVTARPPSGAGSLLPKAEPGLQKPADQAAVAHANKQLGGFKSVASSPTAMPGGRMTKMDECIKCMKSECPGC